MPDETPTPDYPFGAIKQHLDTKAVAVRSAQPADAPTAWAVMDPTHGGHWAPTTEVADWPDIPEQALGTLPASDVSIP